MLSDFPKKGSYNDGHDYTCKDCKSIYRKNYYKLNIEKEKTKAMTHYINNNPNYKQKKIMTIEERREKHKIWRLENKEVYNKKRNKWFKIYKQTNLNYVISHKLRNRIGYLKKSSSAIKELGCSIDEFKTYIESKFKQGMTWDNWTRTGWHMDHIIPLYKFDLQNLEEFKEATHYSNLQPLWAKENLIKNKSFNLEGDENNDTENKK